MGEKRWLVQKQHFRFLLSQLGKCVPDSNAAVPWGAEVELRVHRRLCAGGLAGSRTQGVRARVLDCPHR